MHLCQELIPKLEWAVDVDGSKRCNEVFFEGGDSSFGGVDTVICWWYKLDINVLAGDVLFYNFGAFIVHDVESWFAAFIVKMSDDVLESFLH